MSQARSRLKGLGILLLLGGTLGYGWGVVSGLLDKRTPVWKRVLKGVALTAIPVLLAVIVITIHAVDRKERTYRVLSDTKTAMTQALLYGRDTGHYPTSLQVLREAGYLNTLDKDPWGRDYVLAPILTRGAPPTAGDDVYLYSRGSQGTGTYPRPFTPITGAGGSSGYSSIYGVWREQ